LSARHGSRIAGNRAPRHPSPARGKPFYSFFEISLPSGSLELGSMQRKNAKEILELEDVSVDLVRRAYADLARIHRLLGDTEFVVEAIRRDPYPVRTILDVGCATGRVLEDVSRKLRVQALGIDLKPYQSISAAVTILQADATRDSLPNADVAFSMYVGHHLPENELVKLIRNVGRFCRRFILIDLVRHPLPLVLFRLFVAPFVSRIVAADGRTSIRRSYTPGELRRIAAEALAGSGGIFRQTVAPLYARQAIDIVYGLT
jgi:SAM-dependent methyltransferase